METKIGTQKVKNYLSNLGRKDSKGKILFQRILFDIKTSKTGVEIGTPDDKA